MEGQEDKGGVEHADMDATERIHNKEDRTRVEEEGQDDDDDKLSDSYHLEEASTVDMAEVIEQKNRRNLLFAILLACGVIFLTQQLTRLLRRCFGEDDVVVGEEAGGMVDQAHHALVHQQSMTNLANPAIM
jgi:hypothetical protein